MSLDYYIDAFSSLRMNRSGGTVSPHKACMLFAVMDLVEQEQLINNRIYLDDQLKEAFTLHFEKLRSGRDQNSPHLPYHHLHTSRFWHHHARPGHESQYESLRESSSELKVVASVEHVTVDPELFEYFKSYNARESLREALAGNFDAEIRDRLLNPLRGWSWLECEVIVQDYFAMLEAELRGESYNKSEHNRRLQSVLNNRSKSSIENKHQNISAILKEMGMPTIDGYKPLSNYQRNILPDVIGAQLVSRSHLTDIVERLTGQPVETIPIVDDILRRKVEPPERELREAPAGDYKRGIYRPVKLDYIEREARNRTLGLCGEQFILYYEKARLTDAGRESLADRIEHVSLSDDGLGYDIHSYETNGQDRCIEVKTTRYARFTSFYVTQNELDTSQKLERHYHLYRVFNFGNDPRFFTRQGHISDNFLLSPRLYMADV